MAHNRTNGYNTSPRANHGYHNHSTAWADAEGELDEDEGDGDSADESPVDGVVGANYVQYQGQRQQFDRQCTRTIQFTNLPDSVTHGDITAAVRGGMLLDVFVRPNERTATVSFLHAADARKFFEHVRKNDLYIKNKRVSGMCPQQLPRLTRCVSD